MEHVKTVVSLNRKLYEEGETLASELKISRSRLFALALEEFIRRRRSPACWTGSMPPTRIRPTGRNGPCSGRCAAPIAG